MGQFFGFLWAGVRGKTPADATPTGVRRVRMQERTLDTPEGQVTLRRTTIDEVLPPEPPR
jgi:hypothetical protein